MLLDIKAFDKPLQIREPICKLCLHNRHHMKKGAFARMVHHCTYCNTMKRLIQELQYLIIPYPNLKEFRHGRGRKTNNRLLTACFGFL